MRQWSRFESLDDCSTHEMLDTSRCALQLHYRPGGEQFWMQTSMTPVRENGRVLNHIWVHTDVTEQKVRRSSPMSCSS